MNTLFLATVVGWYLVIVGVYLLLKFDHVKVVMGDIMAQHGLLFILAIITLIIGLLMVASHNIWVMGWPVVITILSWLVLLSGLLRLFLPDVAINMGRSFVDNPIKMKISASISLIIGLFLLFKVYF